MDEDSKYFSEEYSPDYATEERIKIKLIPKSDTSYEESQQPEPYKTGKPYRTVIRARVTRD